MRHQPGVETSTLLWPPPRDTPCVFQRAQALLWHALWLAGPHQPGSVPRLPQVQAVCSLFVSMMATHPGLRHAVADRCNSGTRSAVVIVTQLLAQAPQLYRRRLTAALRPALDAMSAEDAAWSGSGGGHSAGLTGPGSGRAAKDAISGGSGGGGSGGGGSGGGPANATGSTVTAADAAAAAEQAMRDLLKVRDANAAMLPDVVSGCRNPCIGFNLHHILRPRTMHSARLHLTACTKFSTCSIA